MKPLLSIVFVSMSLAGCASNQDTAARVSAHVADMPTWMGGLPEGLPPRRGSPEYDAWQAERAAEAARPKSAPKPN